MTPRRLAATVVLLLACGTAVPPAAVAGASPATAGVDTGVSVPHGGPPADVATPETAWNATLVAAYPNPVARGDTGEFVVLEFPRPTNTTGWTLTDGKSTARLPNRTLEGTVAFSMSPASAREHTDHRVLELDGRLRLADDGDRLELVADGRVVDRARYRNAPESSVRDFRDRTWRPVGATDLEPIRTDGGEATTFVLPDAPEQTVESLRDAEDRLLLAGYTLTSERIADALIAVHERGVEVGVLLDGAPVAGPTARQARLLDRVADAGVDVHLLAGPHVRYRHHHPKYAVVDDTAVVLTENFKPAGTGGMSSRGWGVALHNRQAADALADLYRRDEDWRAATPWERYRTGREFAAPDPALGSFEARHSPARVDVESTTVLVAPDNAEDALVERLDAAEERILVQQVTIDGRDNRLLRATLEAAERGVDVRVLLADAWYVEDDNAELVAWLNRRAAEEGWDLEARVDDPNGYRKIHAKGVVVDDTAVVGSLNWDRSAARENREVVVAVESPAAGSTTRRSSLTTGTRRTADRCLPASSVAWPWRSRLRYWSPGRSRYVDAVR